MIFVRRKPTVHTGIEPYYVHNQPPRMPVSLALFSSFTYLASFEVDHSEADSVHALGYVKVEEV